jgi:uncharacterized protein (TIGR02118 family)
MIKTIGLLTRKKDWTHAQFMEHWVKVHAPLALAVPGLRRYVQNHIQGERTRSDIETTNVEVDGIAELWFDDQASLDRAAQSPEMKALHADGAIFIGRIKSWTVEELFVVGK